MGEIELVFNPIIFNIYGVQMITLLIVVLALIGITIFWVRKELANDK